MNLIDTHSHLYSSKFSPDQAAVVARAREVLSHVFLPNVDLASMEAMNALADLAPDFFFPMMGLHPCSVKEDYKEVLSQMAKEFERRKYFGVGEAGLDY